MSKNSKEGGYRFTFAKPHGPPTISPPLAQGKIAGSVMFTIPGLTLSGGDNKEILQLARNCGYEIWGVDTKSIQNKITKALGTLFTFAFYVPFKSGADENELFQVASRLLVERFLGLFSFFAAMKFSFVNILTDTVGQDGKHQMILTPTARRPLQHAVKVQYPSNLENIVPPEDIHSALFWLRRGLAERDLLDTYSALMLCLQIMARHIVTQESVTRRCPSCGVDLETQQPSITSMMRELIVTRLGESSELFERLWKTRNVISAHGNEPVTPETLLELFALRVDATMLAFKSIKLGLGMPLDSPPVPNKDFFLSDAFMYTD